MMLIHHHLEIRHLKPYLQLILSTDQLNMVHRPHNLPLHLMRMTHQYYLLQGLLGPYTWIHCSRLLIHLRDQQGLRQLQDQLQDPDPIIHHLQSQGQCRLNPRPLHLQFLYRP